ncbi:MAG: tRNA (adenosine(37)-N6)-threonylcarbamoyltransferase complex ATPase subunit type 1 TsaE [Candidatus Levybacteria bacterium]|nr:tRNA (adenosine(37)-N6)-threonylcarbamoyltransferase complex ATPase subunit type 1 TsaE [Candidatus Levybacteria bacterium]
MEKKIFITQSANETQEIAKLFGKTFKGSIIALYGDLGAGKTTFAQGLAKGLGIKKRIISPTFVIVRQYKAGFKNFYHIDLYRIESQKDIEGLGIKEILKDPQNIIVIEWVEKIKDLLPKERIDIYFEYLDENKRKITYEFGY